jgi:hypothetical protein
MSYTCTKCKYSTSDLGNFNRHKKSIRHSKLTEEKSITVVENNKLQLAKTSHLLAKTSNLLAKTSIQSYDKVADFICENCSKKFKHDSSFYRHKKNCKIDISKEKESTKELKIQLEYEKKEKELYKKLEQEKSELLKEKTELLNTFMNNANQIINKAQDNAKLSTEAIQNVSISAIKYANEKFQNAPPLLTLENFNINNLDFNNIKDKESITETLVYHAKLKSLDKLLGEHIIKNYKKDDPKQQSIHTTDCSRLNYIVRELFDNVSKWEVDKNGIKICSKVIKPLIEKCIELLLEHQKTLIDEMAQGKFNNRDNVHTIINVIMSIDKGSLESDINKYIAPHFNMNKLN